MRELRRSMRPLFLHGLSNRICTYCLAYLLRYYPIFLFRRQSPHGVFIWLTASIRFQHCTSLKLLPHCQPDGPRAETLPTIPSIQRSKAPPPMSRRPVGTLREHDGRGFGVVPKPLAANRPSSLRHCSPPFIMMRTSFAGCRLRSLFTCSVVLPGRRAQIHIPNDLATIIAAMTFSSQRRVNASSW